MEICGEEAVTYLTLAICLCVCLRALYMIGFPPAEDREIGKTVSSPRMVGRTRRRPL